MGYTHYWNCRGDDAEAYTKGLNAVKATKILGRPIPVPEFGEVC